MKRRGLLLIAALCAVSFSPAQQETGRVITGSVSDAETGLALENVNVYLSMTMIGTSTSASGAFRLANVPAGLYDMVISRVGYERQMIAVKAVRSESLHYDIRLHVLTLQAGEVQIVGEDPKEWRRNLKLFEKEFLGETENAARCRILNPEVINIRFDKESRLLTASSDSIVTVENLALGYRIRLVLGKFCWNTVTGALDLLIYPAFEELKARWAEEGTSWQENRQRSYRGSLKHFLRALSEGKAEEEHFYVFTGNFERRPMSYEVNPTADRGHPVSPGELLSSRDEIPPFKALKFDGYLRVEYWGNLPRRASFIRLKNQETFFDTLGNLFAPLTVETAGYWSINRVAELQPLY